MRRARAHHLLLLVALLHLAADAAFAGGVVFCVGPNEHRALETEHLAGAGCETVQVGEALSLDSLSGNCTDSPLHAEAEIASRNQDPRAFGSTLLAFPSPFATAASPGAPVVRAHQTARDLGQHLTTQSTIVLQL